MVFEGFHSCAEAGNPVAITATVMPNPASLPAHAAA
jgi:hypothetical protein